MASVQQKGKWWYARFRIDGKQTSRNLGIESKPSLKKKAIALAEKLELELRKGVGAAKFQNTLRGAYEEVSGTPLPSAEMAAFIDQWLDAKRGSVEDGTLEYYRANVGGFQKWLLEHRPKRVAINQITKRDIEAYRSHELKKLSARTVNHKLKTLNMVFLRAVDDGLIEQNPLKGVAKAKEKAPDIRPFTLEEIRDILAVADTEWRSMVLLGFYTGQRLKDISLFRWKNVDLNSREIRFITSKTGRQMLIPIPDPLLEHLAELPSTDDPNQFLHPRAATEVIKQGKTGTISKWFYRVMVDANLVQKRPHRKRTDGSRYNRSPISFHSLRHAATSALKNAGVSDAMAREIIGHESAEINRAYTHFETDAMRQEMENLPKI